MRGEPRHVVAGAGGLRSASSRARSTSRELQLAEGATFVHLCTKWEISLFDMQCAVNTLRYTGVYCTPGMYSHIVHYCAIYGDIGGTSSSRILGYIGVYLGAAKHLNPSAMYCNIQQYILMYSQLACPIIGLQFATLGYIAENGRILLNTAECC